MTYSVQESQIFAVWNQLFSGYRLVRKSVSESHDL